jgi:hypothetical protein
MPWRVGILGVEHRAVFASNRRDGPAHAEGPSITDIAIASSPHVRTDVPSPEILADPSPTSAWTSLWLMTRLYFAAATNALPFGNWTLLDEVQLDTSLSRAGRPSK